MKRLWRNYSLSLALLGLFLLAWSGQAVTGWLEWNDEGSEHGRGAISFPTYLRSGHFIEATGENWESEFLQMALFVIITVRLHQKGSPESNNPDEAETEQPVTARSPWPVRRGGIWLAWYRHSLGLAMVLLFLVSFGLHLWGGYALRNEQRLDHDLLPMTLAAYAWSSQFWFESLQNWQSEFVSLLAMVFLSVYLREAGSAESKPVAAPHDATG